VVGGLALAVAFTTSSPQASRADIRPATGAAKCGAGPGSMGSNR